MKATILAIALIFIIPVQFVFDAGGEEEVWAYAPPDQPTNLEYETWYEDPDELTFINFTWDPPAHWGSSQGLGYSLYRWSNGTMVERIVLRGNDNSTPYSLYTKNNPTPYGETYHIMAVNQEGESLPSNNVTIIDEMDPIIDVYYQGSERNYTDILGLSAYINDIAGISSVWIEYWFDGDEHVNISMTKKYPFSDLWVIYLDLDLRLGMIHYIIRANDTWDNWGVGIEYQIDIVDKSQPVPQIDRTPSYVEAGELLIFDFEIMDNREMGFVAVEIGYDKFNLGNETYYMTQVDDVNWTYQYLTRRRPGDICYRIFGADSVGNTFERSWAHVQLRGDESPIIINNRTPKRIPMGEDITFSVEVVDRRDVGRVWVSYRFEGGHTDEGDLQSSGDNNWSLRRPWPGLRGPIRYQIHIVTAWNQSVPGLEGSIELTDYAKPTISEISVMENLTTGDDFEFWCWATDDVGLGSVSVRYTWGEDEYDGYGMRTDDGIYYYRGVEVPYDAVEFSYWFNVTDIYGNSVNSTMVNTTVGDNDPPEIQRIGDMEGGTGESLNEEFRIRDNIGIKSVKIIVDYPSSGPSLFEPTLEYIYGYYTHYTWKIYLQPNWVGKMSYNMTAEDYDGNIHYIEGYHIEVKDVLSPWFNDVEDHIFNEREEFTITLDVQDNIEIDRLEWEGIPIESSTNELKGSIDERGVYRVNVTAYDKAGNREYAEFMVVIESASGIEDIKDGGGFIYLSIALALIVVLLIVLLTYAVYRIESYKEKVEKLEKICDRDDDVQMFLSSLEHNLNEE